MFKKYLVKFRLDLLIVMCCLLLAGTITGCSNKKADVSPTEIVAATEVAVTAETSSSDDTVDYQLPEGVVPVTWQPSKDNLIIQSDEARELYDRIMAEDYPTLEELENSEVVKQVDALSAYYVAKYGKTDAIDTPERKELREEIKKEFLAIGSARLTEDSDGKKNYVYDGDLKSDYWAEIVLGLPASGKSTRVTDPDSEEMGAFIFDCDVIKTLIPEYQESYGLAADAVHAESMMIMNDALTEFTEGSMKGVNFILPIVSTDLDELMDTYITPLENAGYTVHVKYCDAELNESLARNLARELRTGRIINSAVVFSFGEKPKEVYEELCTMTGQNGEPYVETEEELTEELVTSGFVSLKENQAAANPTFVFSDTNAVIFWPFQMNNACAVS